MTLHAAEPTRERDKIQALEGLRGPLAWWVVGGHLAQNLGRVVPLLSQNRIPVDVFILLSGYVIYGLLDRKHESYGPYLVRRLFRIFPLYLLVLAVSCAMLPVMLQAIASAPMVSAEKLELLTMVRQAVAGFPLHLVFHLPLAQGLASTAFPAEPWLILTQAWSLSLELQFYLIAPLIALALRPDLKTAVIAVVVLLCLVMVPDMTEAFIGGPKLTLFGIGIGCYLFVWRKFDRRLLAGAIAVLCVVYLAIHGKAELLTLPIWFAALGAAYARHIQPLRWLDAILSSRIMVFFGERSFSTYLSHLIPLYGLMYLLDRSGVSYPIYAVALVAGTLGLTTLLSIVFFAWIERPGIALGARIARSMTREPALAIQPSIPLVRDF